MGFGSFRKGMDRAQNIIGIISGVGGVVGDLVSGIGAAIGGKHGDRMQKVGQYTNLGSQVLGGLNDTVTGMRQQFGGLNKLGRR